MTSVFLYSFFVGFGLTLVSVLLGLVDAGLHHGGDLAHGGDLTHGGSLAHGGDLTHSGDLAHGGDLTHDGSLTHSGDSAAGSASSVSAVNFQTLVAALMGFGGLGYVAALSAAALPLQILAAVAGALATAWVILRFQRFLVRGERPLGPSSYLGIVGQLTVSIREGGTGEVVYTQQGSRMVSAARSIDGKAIPRGEQVVILRYEKGVAYVQLWRELMDQRSE